ncbi:hypothetical protein AB0L63_13595 [Nocardia sp. NPDC051990]|uniref:hypothetical protein n=1 Tax=Nocardia sp. NPDC051990 TaxID=3155285 RepID=UPI0034422865
MIIRGGTDSFGGAGARYLTIADSAGELLHEILDLVHGVVGIEPRWCGSGTIE